MSDTPAFSKSVQSVPYRRLGAFYFFYFASLGALLPYWGLYLQSRGLSAHQIGMVMALLSATKVAAPNVLGWIADYTGRPVAWVRIACLLAAVLFLPLLRVSAYGEILVVTLAFGVCWSAALSQFEAVTLAHLGGAAHRYPWIRLWGSVGFIVAVLSLGMGMDRLGVDYLPRVLAVLLGLIWLSVQFVPDPAKKVLASDDRTPWRQLLWQRPVIAFLLAVFLVQAAHGPYYVFYSIYLEAHGYSGLVIGVLWSLGVVAEIVLFITFPFLVRWISLRGLWLAAMLLGTVRWLTIGFGVARLEVLLAAQLLHAATFAVNHAVAMQLLRHYFGTRHQGKGQALYSSLSFGLGSMVGSYLAGAYWQAVGAQWVYGAAAAASLLAFLVAWLGSGRQEALSQ
ncbi:MFS transporter [Methylohalobius crimeensis]|uniref:MFS transporter n=1 Tax=Methylohalobius crimeensis TaxID=244365 RepID=UPI0003B68C38|nr:MFS transporter [Methylohalobius crimeensis]